MPLLIFGCLMVTQEAASPLANAMGFVGSVLRAPASAITIGILSRHTSKCEAKPRFLPALRRAISWANNFRLRGGPERKGVHAACMSTAAAENALLTASDFPRFDAIGAHHVVPGIRHLITHSQQNLDTVFLCACVRLCVCAGMRACASCVRVCALMRRRRWWGSWRQS